MEAQDLSAEKAEVAENTDALNDPPAPLQPAQVTSPPGNSVPFEGRNTFASPLDLLAEVSIAL